MAAPHFTYQPPDKSTLKQGDLLAKNGALSGLIQEVHPFYGQDVRVTHFQVLTQTCDLVRRVSGKCAARYITIAAVRPLDTAIAHALEGFQGKFLIGDVPYCSRDHYVQLRQLVERLYNNNDDEYFFLKAEPSYGLAHDSCTFLPLSIAIRAKEHYEKCVDAKILELRPDFTAKLGWKVGNLYSRIGTDDYAPGTGIGANEFAELVEQTMSRHVRWVPKDRFTDLKRLVDTAAKNGDLINLTGMEENLSAIEQRRRSGRLDTIVGTISRVLNVPPERKDALRNALSQEPLIERAISPRGDDSR